MRQPVAQGLAIFALVVGTSAAVAAQPAPRKVRITDQNGAPVPLAEVKIIAGGSTTDVVSDDDGYVELDSTLWAKAASVHLDVSAVGFEDAGIDLNAQAPAAAVVQLKPATGDGGDIVVVARKLSRPFSPQTLSLIDVVTDPTAQADPIIAVNNLPASTNVTGSSRLTFRGSRASINRAYLNDAPVYEFSTGSEVDSTTENRSVFGLVVADQVETYPGNPPTYLSGATGGVVRVVTPDNKTSGTTVSLSTLNLSGGRVIASKGGDNFVALYASLTDLTLYKTINPGLNRLYSIIRSASGGGLARLTTKNDGVVNIFVQAEAADDKFPFSVYGADSSFRLQPLKERAVVSAAIPVSGMVLNSSASITHSRIDEAFGRSRVDSDNVYAFGSLDFTLNSVGKALNARAGLDMEYVRQTSDTALPVSGPAAQQASRRYDNELTQLTSYFFASYRRSDVLLLSLGGRHTIAGNLGGTLSLQSSATISSPNGQHKLILSAGQYGGAAVPTRAYYGQISRSKSFQAEADYSWTYHGNILGVAAYSSRERSDGKAFDPVDLYTSSSIDNLTGIARLTRNRGFEAYATWLPAPGWDARLSFAKVHQVVWLNGERVRGANDYPRIIRAVVKYSSGPASNYSISFTNRSGEPFTRADGTFYLIGTPVPIYGPINGARLPPYLGVDASVSRRIHIAHLPSAPLFYAALNNVTNHRNPSSQVLALPDAALTYRYLAGRSIVFGATMSF